MNRQPDENLYHQYTRAGALQIQAPAVRGDVPLCYHPDVDDYTMSMGIARTRGGRIWLGYFAGGDNADAVIILCRSDDDGMTFSDPLFYVDPGYVGNRHVSAVVGNLWTAPAGRLFLFITLSLGHFDGRGGVWYSVCENPDDDKPVWSEVKRIWHGAGLQKPTVLADGTWLYAISLWRWAHGFPELNEERGAWVFASKDEGATWKRRGHILVPEGRTFDEHMIVERDDGSLFMTLRNDKTGICTSESGDKGYTWTVPATPEYNSASARTFLRKLASGNFLMVKHTVPGHDRATDGAAPRSHLTAHISTDGCRTWSKGLLLDERPRVSYPDGFQAPDGRIFIQYDRLRDSGEILLAVFTEEDALAGKDVSGKVMKKHPIKRSRSARLYGGRIQPLEMGTMLSEAPFPSFPLVIADSGLKFFIIDDEHGSFDYSTLSALALNSRTAGLRSIVRLPDNGRANITKFSDMGMQGFLLPMTNAAADIREVVKYAKYAPVGKRGISTTRAHTLYNPPPLKQYMADANSKMRIYAQIETKSGVDKIDDILAVEGVDGVIMGPNDLSCDLGCIGDTALIFECMGTISAAARKAGKTWGIITSAEALIRRALELDAAMIAYGSELNMLKNEAKRIATSYRV